MLNEDLNVFIFNGEEDFDLMDDVKETQPLAGAELDFAVKEQFQRHRESHDENVNVTSLPNIQLNQDLYELVEIENNEKENDKSAELEFMRLDDEEREQEGEES